MVDRHTVAPVSLTWLISSPERDLAEIAAEVAAMIKGISLPNSSVMWVYSVISPCIGGFVIFYLAARSDYDEQQ